MSSAIACSRCGRRLRLPAELLGKQVMCPGCSLIFVPREDGTLARPSRVALSRPKRSAGQAAKQASPSLAQPPAFRPKPESAAHGPGDSDLPFAEVDEPHQTKLASAPTAGVWSGPVPPVRRRQAIDPDLPLAEPIEPVPESKLRSLDSVRPPARRRPRFRSRSRGPDLKIPLIIGGSVVGLVVLGLAVFFAVKLVSGSGWQPFTSREGRFTVEMPSPVQTRQQPTPTPLGVITVYMFAAEASRTEVYAVGYVDYPAAILAMPHERIFDEATVNGIAGMANTPGFRGGRATDQRAITIDGHPGRETVIDIPAKGTAVLRVYLVRERLYMLMALGSRIGPASSNVKNFFDSFRLTNPDGPIRF